MDLVMRGKPSSRSRIRPLPSGIEEVHTCSLCIIFIPDALSKPTKNWLESSWKSIRHICPANLVPLVYGFDYALPPKFESIWHMLNLEAETLRECLVERAGDISTAGSRLVFICQGLGGLIAKQALTRIHAPYRLDDQRLRGYFQGIIFFSTPNPTSENRDELRKLPFVLQSSLKLSRFQVSQAEREWAIAQKLSQTFRESVVDKPVVTVYEGRETKISTGRFKSQKHVLIGRSFAETEVRHETLVELPIDHSNLLRNLPHDENMLKIIREFFQNVLAASRPSSRSGHGDPPTVNDVLSESVFQEDTLDHRLESDGTLVLTPSNSDGEISPLEEFASARRSLRTPYRMLKPAERNPGFFGRQDMLTLIDNTLLSQPQTGAEDATGSLQTFAICGLGGVGKTELAREYAFSRQDHFDAVFWIEADQKTQLSEGFAIIASQLGYTDTSDKDRVVSRNIALEWLGNPIKRPDSSSTSSIVDIASDSEEATWLLVFNNADDLDLLQAFWPISHKGSILITSRDPMAKRGCASVGVDLEPFKPDEAATLLRQLTDVLDTPEARKVSLALSERLGGLPLAVIQVAALIYRMDMTLEEFLDYYDKQTSIASIARKKPTIMSDHYKHSLFTVWALESLSPSALASLRVLSFLSPDSIRESLLQSSVIISHAPPPNFPTTEDSYLDARVDLTKVSLVKRRKGSSILTLHRLVQDVVRSQMTEDERIITLEFTIRLVLHSWPTGFLRFDHDSATWSNSEELLPHILRLRGFFEQNVVIIQSPEMVENLAKLLLFAGWYLLERSDFEAAKTMLETVLDLCNNGSLKNEEMRADVLFALSALSAQINENVSKNLQYAQDHFDCRRRLRDGSQFAEDRMAMAYGELSHIQLFAGQYEQAIENAQIAIEITENSPAFLAGDDWPTFSSTHQAFGLAGLGRYDEAMVPLEKSLNYWSSHKNESHLFQLGIIHRAIGYIKLKQGLVDQSFESNSAALRHFKATVGDRSHYTSQMCSSLGAFHLERGEFETASIYFEQALSGYRAHGCYKAQLARTLWRLGMLCTKTGDDTRARESFAEAKSLYMGVVPGHDGSDISMEQIEAVMPITSR